MSGSSRNSDRRSDNAYPREKPKPRTLRQRASDLIDDVSTALNPRTYLEKPAQQQMRDANENYGGGARRRRIDAVVDEAVSGGRPRSGGGGGRSKK